MKRWKYQTLYSQEYVRQTMPQVVGTFEMAMIVMVYMFTVTNPVGTIGGGAAAITYWIGGAIVFFLPSVVASAQLASMFPHEGSTYVWTHKALGGFWSFFATITFWLPGMLAMVGFATTFTSLLQGLNSSWLTEPWQQWLLTIGLLAFAGLLSLQRFRVLLGLVSITAVITYAIVLFIGLTAVIWLLTGHHASVSFSLPNWQVNAGNYGLFGGVIIAYLGMDAPFVLTGESKPGFSPRRAVLWASIAVLAAYLIVSWALLVTEGPQMVNQLGNFSVIAIVEQVFGKPIASIVMLGILVYFPVFLALNGSIFARLLMTTSIDRRLPIGLARLSRNRIPARAVIFQTVALLLFVTMAFLLPYIIPLGRPADLNNEIVTVALSMMALVWSISTIFLFIDLLIFYVRDPEKFSRQRIFPMPVLWFCIIIAPIACVIAIIMTIAYSPLPQIPVEQWRFLVGALTIICLIICAMFSLYATSEAAWQDQLGEIHSQVEVE